MTSWCGHSTDRRGTNRTHELAAGEGRRWRAKASAWRASRILQHVTYFDGTEADVWRRVERAGLRRDGDAFSFHGAIEDGRLRVTASSSGARLLPPPPVEFQHGATDVLLAFRAGGALSIAIADDGVEGLAMTLEPASGVVPAHDHARPGVERRSLGQYAASGLWPGRSTPRAGAASPSPSPAVTGSSPSC